MKDQDMKELKIVLAEMHNPIKTAVKQAVLEAFQSPVFATAIADAIAKANRKWELSGFPPVKIDELVGAPGLPNGIVGKIVKSGPNHKMQEDLSQLHAGIVQSVKHLAPGLPLDVPKGLKSLDEVPGERELWAQAYAAGFRNTLGNINMPAEEAVEFGCRMADLAVKAFRERYK